MYRLNIIHDTVSNQLMTNREETLQAAFFPHSENFTDVKCLHLNALTDYDNILKTDIFYWRRAFTEAQV